MSKKAKEIAAPRLVPIQRTDLSTFDDSFSFLKEKFTAEMQRMDDEMNKFSVNLMTLYGQQGSSTHPGQTSGSQQPTWDALASSPLIQGEGTEKMIKLQFDVSAFDPADIKVEVINDKLLIYGKHEQKTDNLESIREMRRQFVLPHGIDGSTIVSSLSRDGVLTVQAPLPQLVAPPDRPAKVLSKNADKKMADSKHQKAPEADVLQTPAAVTNQVPQSPLSPVSPASPVLQTSTVPSAIGPNVVSPNKTSKSPSKSSKQPSK